MPASWSGILWGRGFHQLGRSHAITNNLDRDVSEVGSPLYSGGLLGEFGFCQPITRLLGHDQYGLVTGRLMFPVCPLALLVAHTSTASSPVQERQTQNPGVLALPLHHARRRAASVVLIPQWSGTKVDDVNIH